MLSKNSFSESSIEWCVVPKYPATFLAYSKSSDPDMPMLHVCIVDGCRLYFNLQILTTNPVIKLLSSPPDNKHAISLSVFSTRLVTA